MATASQLTLDQQLMANEEAQKQVCRDTDAIGFGPAGPLIKDRIERLKVLEQERIILEQQKILQGHTPCAAPATPQIKKPVFKLP